MSALADIYIKKEVLETLLTTIRKKGQKGVSLTLSINDNTNDYGQNVSGFVSQTKEQREANTAKYYVGNGKVIWTDGKIVVAEKKEYVNKSEEPSGKGQASNNSDELPF